MGFQQGHALLLLKSGKPSQIGAGVDRFAMTHGLGLKGCRPSGGFPGSDGPGMAEVVGSRATLNWGWIHLTSYGNGLVFAHQLVGELTAAVAAVVEPVADVAAQVAVVKALDRAVACQGCLNRMLLPQRGQHLLAMGLII